MIDGGLRPLFHDRLRAGFHWQAIETGGTGQGIPDSNFCCATGEGWVEYKWTDGWDVRLKPEQVAWHVKRWLRGGRTWIAVRRQAAAGPRRGAAVDELWMFEGRWARELRAGGLRSNAAPLLGRWSGGPALWDWAAVRRLLAEPETH